MRRVLVIGSSGAGKTTLSKAVADLCNLPLFHLDWYKYQPGWYPIADRAWYRSVAELAAEPAWIMDGYYPTTFHITVPRADTVMWLDLPRGVCIRRCIWRSFRHFGRIRPDIPNGRREVIPALRPVWSFPAVQRPQIVQAIDELGQHLRVIQLRNDSDIEALLAALKEDTDRWESSFRDRTSPMMQESVAS
jgi:hypothetical protein